MTRIIQPVIVEKDLSYTLTGIAFKVQKDLGRFCREKQYADRYEYYLKEYEIPYLREFTIQILAPDSPKGNRVDFYVNEKVLIDTKAKNFITKEDYYQMIRYLDASKLELGLIINFRDSHLKPKRVLNSALNSDHSGENSDHSGRK